MKNYTFVAVGPLAVYHNIKSRKLMMTVTLVIVQKVQSGTTGELGIAPSIIAPWGGMMFPVATPRNENRGSLGGT